MQTSKLIRRLSSPSAVAQAVRWEQRMRIAPRVAEAQLERALRSRRQLVVGPWLSEIGFEVLYWIPMLTRLWAQHRIDPRRVTVISRGGTESWYARLGASYVDVLDHFEPDELREWQAIRHAEDGGQKHVGITALDREVLRRAAGELPERHALVHPSSMYRRFLPFWTSRRSWRYMHHAVRFKPLPKPPALDLDLPPDYVAVKAYFSDCFPATAENRAFLRDQLERLADRSHVVLLSTGLQLDDHADAVRGDDRFISLEPHMTPSRNLAVQTAAIAGARALLCTYGGFAYLGPFLDVPTFSFYSDANFNPTHLEAAMRAARKLGPRGFVPFSVADYESLAATMGAPA